MTIAVLLKTVRLLVAIAVCFIAVAGPASAMAQGSAFTYQGKLTDAGAAANGLFDFEFRLFNSPVSSTEIGSTNSLDDVAVMNGVFSVLLDFGPGAFPGAKRFLDIAVRAGAGTGGFTHLLPRQQITSTPYAIRSAVAGTADVALNVPIDAIPAGNTNYIHNGTTEQTASFRITGTATAAGFIYLSPLTAYYAVNEGAFTARDGVAVSKGTGSGGAYPTSTSEYGLVAPINLPHGATITNIRFFYVDNSANSLTLFVNAHRIASGFYETIATHTTSVQTSAVQTVDVPVSPGWVVDNSTTSLAVSAYPTTTWMNFSMQVRGAIITYTMPRPAR